jgi:hypothetical protein
MWRILVAGVAAGTLSFAAVDRTSEPGRAVRASSGPAHAVSVLGASVAVRRVSAIAVRQARDVHRDVRRCEHLPDTAARAPCDRMALARAGAGARLNAIVLRAAAPGARTATGPCARASARLAGLMGTLAYLAVDGTRSAPWPAAVRADARAAAAVSARIGRLAAGDACVPGARGPRA